MTLIITEVFNSLEPFQTSAWMKSSDCQPGVGVSPLQTQLRKRQRPAKRSALNMLGKKVFTTRKTSCVWLQYLIRHFPGPTEIQHERWDKVNPDVHRYATNQRGCYFLCSGWSHTSVSNDSDQSWLFREIYITHVILSCFATNLWGDDCTYYHNP